MTQFFKRVLFFKSFIISNILLLIMYLLHLLIKYFSNWNKIIVHYAINYLPIFVFIVSIILVFYTLKSERIRNFYLKIVAVFLLLFITLFSYDFILPEEWLDAKGDVLTSKNVVDYGILNFLKNYHYQSLLEIQNNASALESFHNYEKLIPFVNYESTLEKAKITDIHLIEYNRTMHHPPSWFVFLGIWQNVFGSSVLSFKLFSKLIGLLFIFLIFFFISRYLKIDNQFALTIAVLVGFTPRFLIENETPKSDIFFGVMVILFFLQLFTVNKNNKSFYRILINDFCVGLFLSLAVLTKFTGLLLALPVIAVYLTNFRFKGIPRLFFVLFSFILIPVLLNILFGYDMLLNIITGRSKQDFYIENQSQSVSIFGFFTNAILYGLFYVGIPLLVIIFHKLIFSFKIFLSPDKINQSIYFIFYLSIFVLLWRSQVSRHQISFFIFLIPILVNSFFTMGDWKITTKYAFLFLFIYDLLFLVNSYSKLSLQTAGGWIFTY